MGADDDDETDFQDTPLLTSLWEATSQANNDAIDRLLDSSDQAIKARASDGRGLAWWAFEFKNAYVLGSIIANGGDPLSASEDIGGQTAAQICEQTGGCEKNALMETAKGMVEDIKARKEQRAKDKAAAEADDEDDPDFDDASDDA